MQVTNGPWTNVAKVARRTSSVQTDIQLLGTEAAE